MSTEQPAAPKSKVRQGCLGCLGIFVGFAVLGGLATWMYGPSPEEKAVADAAKLEALCVDTTMAYIVSQDFAKRLLKAPATADFPNSRDSGVIVTYLGDCKHRVAAFVDAQNSFGANVRTRYYAEVQNQKGTENWKVLDVGLVE